MTATALVGLGMVFELVGGRRLPGIPDWPAVLSIAVSSALFSALFLRRRRPDVHLASAFFVLNSAAMGFALFMRDPYYAQFGNWMPFQANKLACVVVALLSPELWAGFVAIGIHVASASLVLLTVGPDLRERIVFEPTGTLAFAFVSVGLALYRRRRLQLEREVATSRAETLAAERLARTILAVRDLANTPIQTIELCVSILRSQTTDAEPQFARLQRAISRLRDLSELMRKYESGMQWHERDASLDAIAELEKYIPHPHQPDESSLEPERDLPHRLDSPAPSGSGRWSGVRGRSAPPAPAPLALKRRGAS